MKTIDIARKEYRDIRKKALEVAGKDFTPERFDQLVLNALETLDLDHSASSFVAGAEVVYSDLAYEEAVEAEKWMFWNWEKNS